MEMAVEVRIHDTFAVVDGGDNDNLELHSGCFHSSLAENSSEMSLDEEKIYPEECRHLVNIFLEFSVTDSDTG